MEALARASIEAPGRPLRTEGNSGPLERLQGGVALMMEKCDTTPKIRVLGTRDIRQKASVATQRLNVTLYSGNDAHTEDRNLLQVMFTSWSVSTGSDISETASVGGNLLLSERRSNFNTSKNMKEQIYIHETKTVLTRANKILSDRPAQ
jgi:hypothetical protein